MTFDTKCKNPSVSGTSSPSLGHHTHPQVSAEINPFTGVDSGMPERSSSPKATSSAVEWHVNLLPDFARSSPQEYRAGSQFFPLGKDLSRKLNDFCQKESLTAFSVLLTAYQAVLSRYTGQEEITIACLHLTTQAGKQAVPADWKSQLFIASQTFLGNPSFLSRVNKQTTEYKNREDSGSDRLPSNVLFTFQEVTSPGDLPDAGNLPAGAWIEPFECDLWLRVVQTGDEYSLWLIGNTHLFELDTVKRFLGHFRIFLEAALEKPTQDVASLPLLSPKERHQIVVEWNSAVPPCPSHECLHETFEAQVEKTPDRVAILHHGTAITYRELNIRANRLAHYLKELGAGPETLVGVCLGRSIDTVVALVAILKSGAAYLPLDPHYPQDRIVFMLEDAQVPILLTESRYLNMLPAHKAQDVLIDQHSHAWRNQSEQNPSHSAKRDNLAYVLYTSGSTGRPKGVALMHQSAVALVDWANTVYSSEEYSGVLFATSICFDLSVFEIFAPLSAGGRVILAEDALELARLPEANEVTLINTVPSVIAEVVRMKALPPSVLTINLAGEYSSQELVQAIYSSSQVQRVYDLYGATEDTTHSTLALRTPDGPPSVGRPFPGTQLYVLDSHLQPVPVGVPGEIFLGGAGLARGYLNRPELTAQRFLRNPFIDDPEARIYRTGDLGRFRPDGNLEYLGRIDHQVKIRGFRVELGEIETILNEHPSVDSSVVIAKKDDAGEARLIAYFIPNPGNVPNVESLRNFLSVKLPEYMVPPFFIPLEFFPRTPSGKIDRKSLPEPRRERPDLETEYAAPRNELEKYIADIWSRILQIDQIGIHDRFFQLGGSSLQAARFINELQQLLGETIYIVTIFQSPTIAEYADFLLKDYPVPVTARFPSLSKHQLKTRAGQRKINDSDISAMRKAIPTLPRDFTEKDASEPRNPPAIFILAPPRSGTTLLRIMLAGHSSLFCPAELQLLSFHTLAERRHAFSGKYSLWLEGTIRALMEIHGCDADQAKQIMEEHEARDFTTKQFYKVLQDSIGGRTLVDKSPSYASDLATLQKAERDFDNPIYIHLSRHPYAMSRSFANYHMDQVLFLYDHPFTPVQLGELIWTISHRNILDFLAHVPAHRQFHMRYEDLVTDPEKMMRQMCATINLDFETGLLNPYQNLDSKMANGIYAESTPMGDTHFFKHQKINPRQADSWREVTTNDFLGDPTWSVATLLGYSRSSESDPNNNSIDIQDPPVTRINRRESHRQRRETRHSLRANRETKPL